MKDWIAENAYIAVNYSHLCRNCACQQDLYVLATGEDHKTHRYCLQMLRDTSKPWYGCPLRKTEGAQYKFGGKSERR